jgi:hypothetical protein
LGNSTNILFWYDNWTGKCSFKVLDSELIDIYDNPLETVTQIFNDGICYFQFKRQLTGYSSSQLHLILQKI